MNTRMRATVVAIATAVSLTFGAAATAAPDTSMSTDVVQAVLAEQDVASRLAPEASTTATNSAITSTDGSVQVTTGGKASVASPAGGLLSVTVSSKSTYRKRAVTTYGGANVGFSARVVTAGSKFKTPYVAETGAQVVSVGKGTAGNKLAYKLSDLPASVVAMPFYGGLAFVDHAKRDATGSPTVVNMIPPAWALNKKNGNALSSTYTLKEGVLTQHVTGANPKDIVVADPIILGVALSWWTITRIAACAGGGIWGWISGGGNRWDQRAYQAFLGCASALGLGYLFRR